LAGQRVKTLLPKGRSEATWVPKREYCVQYNETDLNFVKRLLEEEGISFFVEHKRGEDTLVLADDLTRSEKVRTVDGRATPYKRPTDLTAPGNTEYAWGISLRTRMATNRFVLRDFNYADHGLPPTDLPSGDMAPKIGVAGTYESYEYPARTALHYEDDSYAF